MTWWRLLLVSALRSRVRAILTMLAVAVTVAIFTALTALDRGVTTMVVRTGSDLVLTVFERYKACPPFSRLPLHYADRIAAIPGVRAVMAERFLLSNCQTATDLVSVHGIDPQQFRAFRSIAVPDEQWAAFQSERSAAMVGWRIAQRYGWKPGDQVTLKELQGISFVVRGIFAAPGSSLESVILLDRTYVEQALGQVGVETMFLVLVDGARQVDAVSRAIDASFANAATQTQTGPERSFIAAAVDDFRALVQMAQIVGWCALALLAIAVANTVSLSVRDRLRELAVLRTCGYTTGQVVRLVVGEAGVLALAAATLGAAVATIAIRLGGLSIGIEGYTIVPDVTVAGGAIAVVLGTTLGMVAACWPAWRAARLPIVTALREVD